MKLVIAEKPSVAKSIAKVLNATTRNDGYMEGDNYIVTWAIGHLVGLVNADKYHEKYKKWNYDDLPITPQKWKYQISKDKQQQFKVIKNLMFDTRINTIINATDSGREGELIFRLIYNHAKCKKPVQRLWVSSMEDTAIEQGFNNLKDGSEYENLYQSALCRSKADWLVGINMTRLFSTLYNKTLNVGRVQSPTLALVVERNEAIRTFKKEKYFIPELIHNDMLFSSEKVNTEEKALQIRKACLNKQAFIKSIEKKSKTVKPPKLYDLTSLQREANRFYGYTAQQTLDYVQSLYEKKLVTYPRTDSQYITADMFDNTLEVCELIKNKFGYDEAEELNVQLIVNDKKVTDHHAIIPTKNVGTLPDTIPTSEQNILNLIVQKLLCAVGAMHIFETTQITVDCNNYLFTTKGKVIKELGWLAVENKFKKSINSKKEKSENILPEYKENDMLDNFVIQIKEAYTSPPKHFTEDTLLSSMERSGASDTDKEAERKGLGTSATRASIIEKLVSTGLLLRKDKQLIPSDNGIKLITILPEEIKSPKLTSDWENQLLEISKGKVVPEEFLQGIENLIKDIIQKYNGVSEDKKGLFQNSEVIGKCPKCGNDILENKNTYYCTNKECSFTLWKNSKFFEMKRKKLTSAMVKELLKNGKVKVTGLYSSAKDKTYTAYVLLDLSHEKYVNFKLEFIKNGGEKKQAKKGQ